MQTYRIDHNRNAHIVTLVKQGAERAFCGNGTCSPENIGNSCFAIEFCESDQTKEQHTFDFSSLTNHEYAFVVVAISSKPNNNAYHNHNNDPFGRVTFVGCITAAPPSSSLQQQFPMYVSANDNSLVVSNLCVAYFLLLLCMMPMNIGGHASPFGVHAHRNSFISICDAPRPL